MCRTMIALVPALIATVILGAATAAPVACDPQEAGGATLRWCGPAVAKLTWAGKTLTIKGGKCEINKVLGKPYFVVNTGRYTAPPAKPKATAFSALQGNSGPLKPGTQTWWLINFQTPGKQWLLQAATTKVTITKAGAKKATFTGKLGGGGSVTGSWTC